MPPPNITGQLHLGHALFLTIQDIATRHRLQRGDDACWIPGTDHAGLATHEKLTAYLIQQGSDPTDSALYDQQAWAWKERFHARITTQMRAMGIACDWTRERFTLDTSYQDTMQHAFAQLATRAKLYRQDGQWYLDMREAARALLGALDQGEIRITPATATGRLRHFLEHIEPWCISRQIRWGWRLPLLHDGQGSWQLDDHPDRPAPTGWIREQDTADTWLLSSLWPLALLGWPHDQEAMARYFPAAWMETGEDILFFWCARMLMTGWLLTGQWAFRDIWLQGLIRDKHGCKMSKSLDNAMALIRSNSRTSMVPTPCAGCWPPAPNLAWICGSAQPTCLPMPSSSTSFGRWLVSLTSARRLRLEIGLTTRMSLRWMR